MTARYRQIILNNYNAFLELATSVETLFIFIVGLGRYRVVLFFVLFYLVKAMFTYAKLEYRVLYIFFLPLFLFFLWLDISNGQFFPVFPRQHFVVTILSLVLINTVFTKGYATNLLIKLSENTLFKDCPKCRYDNKTIVKSCSNCSYEKEKTDIIFPLKTEARQLQNISDSEILSYRKLGLYRKISPRVLNLIDLNEGEEILIVINIFPCKSIHKNGSKLLLNSFLISTEKIILIDYDFMHKGWRYREYIQLQDIIKIKVEMKQINIKKSPVLILETTGNDSYEMFYSSFPSIKDKFSAIIACIKKRRLDLLVDFNAFQV